MSQIVLGKSANANVHLDLDVLLRTRLLVTADSGGGKTVLLKRLCEQIFGKVPIIIIDPEGEFSPLREKFGFVLVGPGGETPADPRSAGLVAQTLLKLRASAVCDLYEMKPSARHEWVKNFCDALIDAPKALWHPTIVIVDEASIFCPESKAGESQATESVKALGTRGRKRGICLVAATQRLAELNKGVSGMCLNRLVGGTFEDVNQKRALDVLSVNSEDKAEFLHQLKLLEPGYFFALGRAICTERTLVKVGPIETAHGDQALKYANEPPPAPEQIAKLLPQLADLPKAAEEKAKNEAELRKEIRELKAQVRTSSFSASNAVEKRADPKAIERAVRAHHQTWLGIYADLKSNAGGLLRKLNAIQQAAGAPLSPLIIPSAPQVSGAEIQSKGSVKNQIAARQNAAAKYPTHATPNPLPSITTHSQNGDGPKGTPRKILQALAEFEAIGRTGAIPRPMVASWCGIKPTTGTFKNYLSELRTGGYIQDANGDELLITDAGREAVPPIEAPATTEAMLERAASIFGGTPAKILRIIHSAYPHEVAREDIAEQLQISADTGTFKNYLSELRVTGLIVDCNDKRLKAAEWMFI